jgi:taurine dioxygenase
MGSILHLNTVPPNGGDTLFASSLAAYEALSAPMQKFLGELTARHDGSPNYNRRARIDGKAGDKQYPFADHPVIRTHPVTGRKGIYVSPVFTQYINDVPEAESKAILDFLYAHTKQERFVCRFSWEKNSVAFWDNRAVQHLAMWDYFPQVRSGFRVTVAGDKPF